MTARLKKLLEGDIAVTVLLWAAALTFGVHILTIIPDFIKFVQVRPFVALFGTAISFVNSLWQPALLLGIAKLIDMKKTKNNIEG